MATLIFSALGTLFGGPIGGLIGAIAGRQVDGLILGGGKGREGPRLKELSLTTSSYGSLLPRHYGRMRAAGTIIWATDLIEHRDKQGGGKGQPSVTSYSYTASFAVALASRPIKSVGRIWADGNLLRGAAGDLKSAGIFRIHTGEGDQAADALISAAEGAATCPAFRGLAYAVFEDLELGDFGNRIPALTFEVIADDGTIMLDTLLDGLVDDIDAAVPLSGVIGLTCEDTPANLLTMLDPVFPMDADASGNILTIAPERLQSAPFSLPEAAISSDDGDFGKGEGFASKRSPEPQNPVSVLRYYDTERDYQPGAQRASGRAGLGEPQTIELAVATTAATARQLVESAAKRARWGRHTLSWRVSQLDPAITPGAIVIVPGHPGRWRVREWEWREAGIELSLTRLPPDLISAFAPADPGRANLPPDQLAAPSALAAFELPWDGSGSAAVPAVFAATSSPSAAWGGAALFVDQGDGNLQPLGPSGRGRSILGNAFTALPAKTPQLVDRDASVVVELLGSDMLLTDATLRQLAQGANRALLGQELIQFATAVPLGDRQWRLSGLLRGRGGSEPAIAGHTIGEAFILLDGVPLALDPAQVGPLPEALIAAIGLGDTAPVSSPIACRGITQRPLAPVHGRRRTLADGSHELSWTRRARGGWLWQDGVDVPLNEQFEAYEVTFGGELTPAARWELTTPILTVPAAMVATLANAAPTGAYRIRQRGDNAVSDPLVLPSA